MPCFFFHIRCSSDQSVSLDELGLDFPDVETAYVEAFRAARDLKGVFTRRGQNPWDYAIEVMTAQGELVISLPFSEIFEGHAWAVALHPKVGRIVEVNGICGLRTSFSTECCDIRLSLGRKGELTISLPFDRHMLELQQDDGQGGYGLVLLTGKVTLLLGRPMRWRCMNALQSGRRQAEGNCVPMAANILKWCAEDVIDMKRDRAASSIIVVTGLLRV